MRVGDKPDWAFKNPIISLIDSLIQPVFIKVRVRAQRVDCTLILASPSCVIWLKHFGPWFPHLYHKEAVL